MASAGDSPIERLLAFVQNDVDQSMRKVGEMQSKLEFINELQEKGDSPIGGLSAFVQNEIDQSMRKVRDMQSKLQSLKELQKITNEFKMSKALDAACEKATKAGDTIWSLALASLKPKLPNSKEWSAQFTKIQGRQVTALRMMHSILRPEKLQLCFRTWSDISRAANSALGSNITDMQVSNTFCPLPCKDHSILPQL